MFDLHQNNQETRIPCGRPASAAETIPVTLLDPILAQFSEDWRSIVPTEDDNSLARTLCVGLSKKFDGEEVRKKAMLDILTQHGIYARGGTIQPLKAKATYRTDGELITALFRYMILEIKNEIGYGGSEPFYEAILYYLESFRELREKVMDKESGSNFPCLIMLHFGTCSLGSYSTQH